MQPDPITIAYGYCRLLAWGQRRISGLFFSHTFQSDQSLPRALGFTLCAACGSVVLLHAARVFDYFVVIEVAFMDNQAQRGEFHISHDASLHTILSSFRTHVILSVQQGRDS